MTETEKYLNEVAAGLYRLPEHEKTEILNEIRSHIHEAVSQQESEQTVLDRLGSPLRLAQSYVSLSNIESGQNILSTFAFYFSAGIATIVVVPSLFFTALSLVISAVAILGYSIVRLFVILPYPMRFWEVEMSGIPAVIASVVIGLIHCVIALLCWKLLKKYLAFISLRYQKIRLTK